MVRKIHGLLSTIFKRYVAFLQHLAFVDLMLCSVSEQVSKYFKKAKLLLVVVVVVRKAVAKLASTSLIG